jgi:redox-sensing transcriptional repressor
MRYRRIPNETIRRLPVYLRALLFLSEQGKDKNLSRKKGRLGTQRISSRDLAEFVGVHSWQIRKDFSYFGDFGTPGVGYNSEKLAKQIKKILKLDVVKRAALVGVGNLGSAVLAYPGFKMFGFDIAVAFDADPKKIGRKIKLSARSGCGIVIENVSRIPTLKKRGINIAIITVPRDAAQPIASALVKAGVTGILNFSPWYIIVPKRVKVITIDIAMDMARLPYYMPAC